MVRLKLLVGFVLLAAAIAFGQATSGDLIGTVLDKSGAVVAGATVAATNQATGVKSTTITSSTGEYRFPNLPIGKYDVTVSAKGFAVATMRSVIVELNKIVPIKFNLSVATVSMQVEVTEAPTVIDTATAQLQSSYNDKALQDLPTTSVGSGVLNLSLLQAGVATANGMGAGTGPSVGGQRPRNNNFTVEGIDNNDKGVTGPLIYVPNDAVAEFTVLQNQYSPEFGHSTGGQFNSVVQSGTNTFHGRVYEYFRNRNLNAMDRQEKLVGETKNPRYDNNRFGGQLGGPIVKNKLFFFANYEYNPWGFAATPGTICAPTSAGYSALLAVPGVSSANINGLKSFAVAPSADSSGTCQTVAVSGQAIELGVLPLVPSAFQNTKALTTSVDYNFTEKDQLRARYLWNKVATLDNNASLSQFYTTLLLPYDLATLSEYHTFSPNINNEFRIGYNRYGYNYTVPGGALSKFLNLDMFPNITIDELGLNLGPDGNAPQYSMQNTYQLTDNLSWNKGAHSLKFGFETIKHIAPQMFIQRMRGDYEWSTLAGYAFDRTPDALAERSLGNAGYSGDDYALYWFVNDSWKVNQHLTVNLGLRYEFTSTPYGWKNQKLNSIADAPGLITFESPRFPKTNFMPRIGFAYSPGTSGNTSIRGGFGMGYDILYDNIGLLAQPPEIGATTIDCDPTKNVAGCPLITQGFLANGGIKPFSGSGVQVLDQASARAATASYLPNDVKLPYSIQWNLGVQHVFAKDYTAEVRYVGTRGVHLDVQNRLNAMSVVTKDRYLPTFVNAPSQTALDALTLTRDAIYNINNVVPAYDAAGFNGSWVVGYMPWGTSIYHGLQTQLNRRFTDGLEFQVAYTWSHNIDNSTADFFSTVFTPRRQQDFQDQKADRSNSALDRRHRLTISGMWDVPWFKKSNNWFMKNILGNYQFSPIYTFESGEWADVQSGVDSNLNGDSAGDRAIWNPSGNANIGSGVRPACTSGFLSSAYYGYMTGLGRTPVCGGSVTTNLLNEAGDKIVYGTDQYVVGYIASNPNARYIVAGPGALATAGRNTLQMRPIDNFDFAIMKRINFKERYRFELTAQALNLFNHHQYVGNRINDVAQINMTTTDLTVLRSNYLVPSSAHFNQPEFSLSSNPRQLILSAKFVF